MIKKGFFLNKWNSVRETTISNSGKLRNYFQFKCKFGCENYLNLIKDFLKRQAFLKFRISNHRLQIETGRYIKPKIAPEDWICEKCYSSEVEDEQHFLLNYGFYHNHRNKLFKAIKLTCKFVNFKLLSSLNKLFWLLNSENINILTEICRFLLDSHCISDKLWYVLYYLNSYYYLLTVFVSCIYAPCGPYYG